MAQVEAEKRLVPAEELTVDQCLDFLDALVENVAMVPETHKMYALVKGQLRSLCVGEPKKPKKKPTANRATRRKAAAKKKKSKK